MILKKKAQPTNDETGKVRTGILLWALGSRSRSSFSSS
jgi:hypothetical protein